VFGEISYLSSTVILSTSLGLVWHSFNTTREAGTALRFRPQLSYNCNLPHDGETGKETEIVVFWIATLS